MRSIIKLFQLKTCQTQVLISSYNKIHTKTLADGYFKFCIPLSQNDYGWINYEVSIEYKMKL
jgi:hypothetical protein